LFHPTVAPAVAREVPSGRAVLFDIGTGHSLDAIELGQFAARLREKIGQPLELLGMDACLMASLEVAYQVRESVNFLVASAELVPGHSWPYDRIYGDLRDHAGWTGAELGRSVVHHYTEYYGANPPIRGDVTKVALDLRGIDVLAEAVSRLGQALIEEIEAGAGAARRAQIACYETETLGGTRNPNKFDYQMWDLGALALQLANAESEPISRAARGIVDALSPGGPTVLAAGHLGDWFNDTGGVSIYMMPPGQGRISEAYAHLDLAQPTLHWHDFLHAYHAHYD
jgi:hypothetical protein